MTFLRKVISSVCALSMIATMAISAVSVQAAEKGLISADVTAYDKTTGEGTITVSFKNLEDIIADCTSIGAMGANVTGFANSIQFDGSFDTSLYSAGEMPWDPNPYEENITKTGSWTGNFAPGPYDATENQFTISITGAKQTKSTELYSFKFKVNDTSKNNTIVVYNAYANVNAYVQQNGKYVADVFTYGDSVHGSTKTTNTLAISNAPIAIVIPADGSALNVDPTDVGLDADAWTDGTSTVAVGLANVAAPASAASKIEWTIKATPVGGSEETKTQSFDLDATIEAAATIGLIVNYDTNEFSSVSVVSGALK